jgi:hypothetical protein
MAREKKLPGPRVFLIGVGLVLGAGVGILAGVLVGGWASDFGIIAGAGIGLMIGAVLSIQQAGKAQ